MNRLSQFFVSDPTYDILLTGIRSAIGEKRVCRVEKRKLRTALNRRPKNLMFKLQMIAAVTNSTSICVI